MSAKPHWETVYSSKGAEQLGWYLPHLCTSLAMIEQAHLPKDAHIIDVGGGASTLVDDLLTAGFEHITVLDIATHALAQTRSRLEQRAALIHWQEGDITRIELPAHEYDLWHDRAVFHFLIQTAHRQHYLNQLHRALKPGGHLVMATFAPEAPPRCSGLDVVRYSLEQLQRELGTDWRLHEHQSVPHVTPGGVEQMYLYCRFQKPA